MATSNPALAARIARYVILAVISLLLIIVGKSGFAALAALKKAPEEVGSEPPPLTVQGQKVLYGEHLDTIVGYGEVRALRHTRIAAQVSGRILSIDPGLEPGFRVKTKTALVRIDSADAEAARRQAEARKDQATETIKEGEGLIPILDQRIAVADQELGIQTKELKDLEGLGETNSLSESEVDRQRLLVRATERLILGLKERKISIQRQIASAKRELDAATSAWERADRDVERCEVSVPYDAVVQARNVSPGDLVNSGTVLFEILDPEALEVAVSLPASRRPEVAVGAKLELRLREGGKIEWTGAVERIAPLAKREERSFEVYARITGGDVRFIPGTFVVASVTGARSDHVVAVPRTAFLGERLFVVSAVDAEGHGAVKERFPEVKKWLPTTALISGGLDEGELVALSNLESIAEGSRVRVVLPGEEKNGAERGR